MSAIDSSGAVFFFHQLYFIEDDLIVELLDLLCDLLKDSNVRGVERSHICLACQLVLQQIEVREAAATTLSGIVRVCKYTNWVVTRSSNAQLPGYQCSQRRSILKLKVCCDRSARIPNTLLMILQERFLRTVRTTTIPRRRTAAGKEVDGYLAALTTAHSGVLGAAALIAAWPYGAETSRHTCQRRAGPDLYLVFTQMCRRGCPRS